MMALVITLLETLVECRLLSLQTQGYITPTGLPVSFMSHRYLKQQPTSSAAAQATKKSCPTLLLGDVIWAVCSLRGRFADTN